MEKIGEPVRLKSLLFGFKGYNTFMSTYKSITRFSASSQAQFRLKLIKFFNQFDLKTTFEAFGVSKATVYRWKKKLKESGGKLESLVPASTAPKTKRKMMVEPLVVKYIANLRRKHPNLGKRKIKVLLDEYCLENDLTTIAESTIGKVIKRFNLNFGYSSGKAYHNPSSAWAQKKVKRRKRTRVRYSPKVDHFGYLEVDTIVKFIQGLKLYVYNALDIRLKFQFSLAYPKAKAQNTTDFFQKLEKVYPLKGGIKIVQTDNGSEYQGVFEQYLKNKGIKQFFIYPRCPKINAYVERANRTLQEEFLNWHQDLALTSLNLLNQKLATYLIWYNTERPHESLNDQSPINYLLKVASESQKYVTCTPFSCCYKKRMGN